MSGATAETAAPELPERYEYVESLETRRLMRMKALGLISDEQLWGELDPRLTFMAYGVRPPEYCRRPGWTMGPAVRLADGRRWRLPRLTPALAITTPGLMAAVRRFVRTFDPEESGGAESPALSRRSFAANDVVTSALGVNYDLSWLYGPGGRPLSLDERAEQHLDNLARVTSWMDAEAWAFCINAVFEALEAAPGFMNLCTAFDPALGLGDSFN